MTINLELKGNTMKQVEEITVINELKDFKEQKIMENKAIFNDTTDVKEAYKSLQNIAKLSEGTENEGITKRECKRVEEFIDYIMKRLETSETDRFGLMSLV